MIKHWYVTFIGALVISAVGCGTVATGGAPGVPGAAEATLAAAQGLYQWEQSQTRAAEAHATAVAQITVDAIQGRINDAAAIEAEARAAAAVAEAEALAERTSWDSEWAKTATPQAAELASIAEQNIHRQEMENVDLEQAERAAQIQIEQRYSLLLTGLAIFLMGVVAYAAYVIGNILISRFRVQPVGDQGYVYNGMHILPPPPPPQLTAGRMVAVNGNGNGNEASADFRPVTLPPLRTGSVLIAGRRNSGKTTALNAILAHRRDATVYIVDPHDQPGKWPGAAHVYGRHGNYSEILDALNGPMLEILESRTQLLGEGVPEEELQSDPILWVIDELPAIVENCGRIATTTPRRYLLEMRKLGGDVLIATQGDLVEMMGLKGYGAIRKHFDYSLYLGDLAVERFPRLVAGMERPAVLTTLTGQRPVIIPRLPAAAAPSRSAAPPIVTFSEEEPVGSPDDVEVGVWEEAGRPAHVIPDPQNISEYDEQVLVDSFRAYLKIRPVVLRHFPHYKESGGQAFKAVRAALVKHGMLEPGPDGRYYVTDLARYSSTLQGP